MEIEITIDNKKIKCDSSQTILEVAKSANINIPTLCYLKDLNKPASCRVCVVEVEGMRNLVTACSTSVKENMVVKTNTTKVINARKTALELLLSNHNKNCLNCGKNLKCEFQKLVEQYHCDTEKFDGEVNKCEIDDTNHAIIRDVSKCILCGKCVSVCSKVEGVGALSKINRGFKTKIGTSFDRCMQNSSCVGCGQCVLVCPTGALTQKNNIPDVLYDKYIIR